MSSYDAVSASALSSLARNSVLSVALPLLFCCAKNGGHKSLKHSVHLNSGCSAQAMTVDETQDIPGKFAMVMMLTCSHISDMLCTSDQSNSHRKKHFSMCSTSFQHLCTTFAELSLIAQASLW